MMVDSGVDTAGALSVTFCIWMTRALPKRSVYRRVQFLRGVWSCRRWHRNLAQVRRQVPRIRIPEMRGWHGRVGEVLTERCPARAHDVDYHFGRVDEHRGVTGLYVGRYGEFPGVENDREDIL